LSRISVIVLAMQVWYTASMSDNAFEIIETRAAIPSGVSRKNDGFSRQDVVNAFQRAFTMIGGVQRLALWANQNPDKFYPLYAKLMPSTSINIGDNSVIQIVHALAPTELDKHPTPTELDRYPRAPHGGSDQVERREREDFLGQQDIEDVRNQSVTG
jgi:hypothetical protein